MGKVFNDHILKFLCAKYLNEIQHDICKSHHKSPTSSTHLRRGESYVVFLDHEHRKQLQQEMGGLDLNILPRDSPFCTCGDTNWHSHTFDRHPAQSQFCELPESMSTLLERPHNGKLCNRQMVQSVFGLYLDEPMCSFIDYVCHLCLCMMFGRHFVPVETLRE